jgi:hypothetical protein
MDNFKNLKDGKTKQGFGRLGGGRLDDGTDSYGEDVFDNMPLETGGKNKWQKQPDSKNPADPEKEELAQWEKSDILSAMYRRTKRTE